MVDFLPSKRYKKEEDVPLLAYKFFIQQNYKMTFKQSLRKCLRIIACPTLRTVLGSGKSYFLKISSCHRPTYYQYKLQIATIYLSSFDLGIVQILSIGIINQVNIESMTSKNKVIFNINANLPQKIKLLTLHPKKEWLALITTTNTFSLWNYKQKTLIKSFNSNTLDDSKNFEIREMVFFDRYSLPYNSNLPMRTNIIFVSPYRIYLYDYLTDAIKQINEKEIQQKNIRKICVYSQSKICVSLGDGSFKILDSRDLYTKNTMTIKNIRGYHTKPITWLIAYCQNANEMPRVITVSAQDGLMACWNVDTLLHSQVIPDPASPSFKFLMQKGTKSDSNNGEEILSLQYDSSSYRLITLTDSYITIWSTMTGMELRRLKNHKYKEIVVCNHFSFGANCFLVHNGKPQLLLLRQNANEYEVEECVDFKNYLRQADNNIVSIKTLPQNPAEIFVCTQSNLFVIEINKFYRPSYGFHHSFTTKLTTLNVENDHIQSKEFVIRSEGAIRQDISRSQAEKIHFEEDILFNSFFLSFQNGSIQFNLMEIQFQNMLYQQRKYKILKVGEDSLLSKPTNTQALIEVRFDGKEFFVFNRDLNYYEIYADQDTSQEGNLLTLNETSTPKIDFSSKLGVISRGYAKDIVWHQFKEQVGIIKGFDKAGKMVEFITEKKGFFGKSQRIKLNGDIADWFVCIYQKSKRSNRYEIVIKTQALKTKLFRIFNFGYFFGYSSDQNGTQIITFVNDEKSSNKEIVGVPIWPERVFVSFCENYQIYVYDGYFIIYRTQETGQLSYFRSVQETIHEGMFWQKFFFFSTKTSIFFLQITVKDILLIKIADSVCRIEERTFNIISDDLEDGQNKIPEGQLQFLSVVNYHLLMLNYSGQVCLLNLKAFPYIQFCIEVILGNTDRISFLFKNCNSNLQKSMRQTMQSYGLILSDHI